MAIVVGAMSMGRIERVAGCSVATRFSMINGVPLSAHASFIDLGPLNGGEPIQIPLNRRSVLAGYLRPWLSILASLGFVVAVWHPVLLAVAVPFAVLSGYMWAFFGRLSPSETRCRLAYATWLGAPFDPAHLSADTEMPCVAALRQFVDERSAQAPVDYRARLGEPWRAVAPGSDDPALLIAALTRARLERRGADRAARVELDALHAAIWARLGPMLAAGEAPAAFLAWQEHIARDEKRRRVTAPLLIAGIAALAFGGTGLTGLFIYIAQPTLAIANVSGADGMTVFLDGEAVTARLPTARRENDAAFATVHLKAGEHELVAHDGSGAELDRRRFVVARDTWQAGSFLYVPVRSSTICFFRERVTYSDQASHRDHAVEPLDMPEPLLRLPKAIDHWFEPAPLSVHFAPVPPELG